MIGKILLLAVSLIIVSSAYSVLNVSSIKPIGDLLLEENIVIHPIIENEEMLSEYQYIRTLKVYYKDLLNKPIKLQNGDKLYNRCSWQSSLTFYSKEDSLEVVSTPRMSCEIVAFINLELTDIQWLKANNIYKLKVDNLTTDYNITVVNTQPEYLKDLLTLYNAK